MMTTNFYRFLWLLISLAIPVIGVLWLHWDLEGLIYLFWVEMILWGVFGLLRLLLALDGRSFISGLLSRLFLGGAFAVLYIGLLLLVIGYSLKGLDTDALAQSATAANRGLGLALIVLFVRFLTEFSRDYLLAETFRLQAPMEVIFETFAFALPLACVILFALVPYAEKAGGATANLAIVLGILLTKTLLEYGGYLLRKRLEGGKDQAITPQG